MKGQFVDVVWSEEYLNWRPGPKANNLFAATSDAGALADYYSSVSRKLSPSCYMPVLYYSQSL